MNIRIIFLISLLPSISACSGNHFFQKTNDFLTISSSPVGADVYVMGEKIGLTPTQYKMSHIFPVTYSADQVDDYGRVTLKHGGCEDKTVMVNAYMISNGLDLKLNCQIDSKFAIQVQPSIESFTATKKRLQKLQALREDNLINEQEFKQIRQRILDAL